jgi:hypothetical protein
MLTAKVFLQIKDLNQAFIARVHHDRTLDDGRKLKAVAEGLDLPFCGKAWLKVQGKYPPVDIHFGFEPIKLLGQDFTAVNITCFARYVYSAGFRRSSLRLRRPQGGCVAAGCCLRTWKLRPLKMPGGSLKLIASAGRSRSSFDRLSS